jgi:uncharacterized damage-inducible protein DinB
VTNQPPRDFVSFSELLDYAEQESARWHAWFNKNPQALDVEIDIAESREVRDLLRHIILVDLLYADWLLGGAFKPPGDIPAESVDSLFAAASAAFSKLRRVLETTSGSRWDEMMSFPKPMENLKASRRKCLVHTILHATRHWAQLATALRAAGFKQDWHHDFIVSSPMP